MSITFSPSPRPLFGHVHSCHITLLLVRVRPGIGIFLRARKSSPAVQIPSTATPAAAISRPLTTTVPVLGASEEALGAASNAAAAAVCPAACSDDDTASASCNLDGAGVGIGVGFSECCQAVATFVARSSVADTCSDHEDLQQRSKRHRISINPDRSTEVRENAEEWCRSYCWIPHARRTGPDSVEPKLDVDAQRTERPAPIHPIAAVSATEEKQKGRRMRMQLAGAEAAGAATRRWSRGSTGRFSAAVVDQTSRTIKLHISSCMVLAVPIPSQRPLRTRYAHQLFQPLHVTAHRFGV